MNVELVLKPESEGTKLYEFVPSPWKQEVLENNTRTVLVEVQKPSATYVLCRGPSALGVQVHPAVSCTPDTNLQLESLMRTALNKFYRQGIQEATTLANQVPSDREELFGYKGIIFGSVESSFLPMPRWSW